MCSAERTPHFLSPCEPRKQYLHPNGQPLLETEDVFGVTSSSSQGMAELLLACRLHIGTCRYSSRTPDPYTSFLNSSKSPNGRIFKSRGLSPAYKKRWRSFNSPI